MNSGLLTVLGALSVSAALLGCHRSESRGSAASEPVSRVPAAEPFAAASSEREPAPSSAPAAKLEPFVSEGYRQIAWAMQGPFGAQPVLVVVPNSADEQHRLPVLLAFHGRGEALKSPARGARGFVDDYGLLRALEKLESPPLTRADFGGMVSDEHLQQLNRGLQERPYQGLIVVCPYLPDILRGDNLWSEGKPLADFIADRVLPRVHAETPALLGVAHTAIDGVSLGGRAALALLAYRADAFAVLGATQPAVDLEEITALASLAARARQQYPQLLLRLLTSDEDYFLQTTLGLSQAMRAMGAEHQLEQVQGDHSYEFNRGPGVYEMLLFHDRALHR